MIIPSSKFTTYINSEVAHQEHLVHKVYLFDDRYEVSLTDDNTVGSSNIIDVTDHIVKKTNYYKANYYEVNISTDRSFMKQPRLFMRAANTPHEVFDKQWKKVENGCNYPDNVAILTMLSGHATVMTITTITDEIKSWEPGILKGKNVRIFTDYTNYKKYRIIDNTTNKLILDTDDLYADGVSVYKLRTSDETSVLSNGELESWTGWTAIGDSNNPRGLAPSLAVQGATSVISPVQGSGCGLLRGFDDKHGVETTVDLTEDVTYEMTGWFSLSLATDESKYYVDIIDEYGVVIVREDLTLLWPYAISSTTGQWIKFSFSFEAQATGTHTIRVWGIYGSSDSVNSTNRIWLDDLTIKPIVIESDFKGAYYQIESNGFSSADDGRYFQYVLVGGSSYSTTTNNTTNIVSYGSYTNIHEADFRNLCSFTYYGDGYGFSESTILYTPTQTHYNQAIWVDIGQTNNADQSIIEMVVGEYDYSTGTFSSISTTQQIDVTVSSRGIGFYSDTPITMYPSTQYGIRIRPLISAYENQVQTSTPSFNMQSLFIDTGTAGSIPSTHGLVYRTYTGVGSDRTVVSTSYRYGYHDVNLYADSDTYAGIDLLIKFRSNESDFVNEIGDFSRSFDETLNEFNISDVNIKFNNAVPTYENRYSHDHNLAILTSHRFNEPVWVARGYRYEDDTEEIYHLGKFIYRIATNSSDDVIDVTFDSDLALLDNIDSRTFGIDVKYLSDVSLKYDESDPENKVVDYYLPHRDIVPESIERIMVRNPITGLFQLSKPVEDIGDLISTKTVQINYSEGKVTTGSVTLGENQVSVGGAGSSILDNFVTNPSFDVWEVQSGSSANAKYKPSAWDVTGSNLEVVRNRVNSLTGNAVQLRATDTSSYMSQTVDIIDISDSYVISVTYKCMTGTAEVTVHNPFTGTELTMDSPNPLDSLTSTTWTIATSRFTMGSVSDTSVEVRLTSSNGGDVIIEQVGVNSREPSDETDFTPKGYKIYPQFYTGGEATKLILDTAGINQYEISEPHIPNEGLSNKKGINVLGEFTYNEDKFENGFIPSSTAYDEHREDVYVSSDRSSKIYRINKDKSIELFADLDEPFILNDFVNGEVVTTSELNAFSNPENFIDYAQAAPLNGTGWVFTGSTAMSTNIAACYRDPAGTGGNSSIRIPASAATSTARLDVNIDYDYEQGMLVASANIFIRTYNSGTVRIIAAYYNGSTETKLAEGVADTTILGQWQRVKTPAFTISNPVVGGVIRIYLNGSGTVTGTGDAEHYASGFGLQYVFNENDNPLPFYNGMGIRPTAYEDKSMQKDGSSSRWKIFSILFNPIHMGDGSINVNGDDCIYIYAYYDNWNTDKVLTYGRIFRIKTNTWYEGEIIQPVTTIFNCSNLGNSIFRRDVRGEYTIHDIRNTGAKMLLDTVNNCIIFKFTVVGDNDRFDEDTQFRDSLYLRSGSSHYFDPYGHSVRPAKGHSYVYCCEHIGFGDNNIYTIPDPECCTYQFSKINLNDTIPYENPPSNLLVNPYFTDLEGDDDDIPSDWTVAGGGYHSGDVDYYRTGDKQKKYVDIYRQQPASVSAGTPVFMKVMSPGKIGLAFSGSEPNVDISAGGVYWQGTYPLKYHTIHNEISDDYSEYLNETSAPDNRKTSGFVAPFGDPSAPNNAFYIYSPFPISKIRIKLRDNAGQGISNRNLSIVYEHYRKFEELQTYSGNEWVSTKYVWTPINDPLNTDNHSRFYYYTVLGPKFQEDILDGEDPRDSGASTDFPREYVLPNITPWVRNILNEAGDAMNMYYAVPWGPGWTSYSHKGLLLPQDAITYSDITGDAPPFVSSSKEFSINIPDTLVNWNRFSLYEFKKNSGFIGTGPKQKQTYQINSQWDAAPIPPEFADKNLQIEYQGEMQPPVPGYWFRIRIVDGDFSTKEPEIEWIKLAFKNSSEKLHGRDAVWLGSDPNQEWFRGCWAFPVQAHQTVGLSANKTYGVTSIIYGEVNKNASASSSELINDGENDMYYFHEYNCPPARWPFHGVENVYMFDGLVAEDKIKAEFSVAHMFLAKASLDALGQNAYKTLATYLDNPDDYHPWRYLPFTTGGLFSLSGGGYRNTVYSPLSGSFGDYPAGDQTNDYQWFSFSALGGGLNIHVGDGPISIAFKNAEDAQAVTTPRSLIPSLQAKDDGSWWHAYYQVDQQANTDYIFGLEAVPRGVTDVYSYNANSPAISYIARRAMGKAYDIFGRTSLLFDNPGIFEIRLPVTMDKSGSFDVDPLNGHLYYWDHSEGISKWTKKANDNSKLNYKLNLFKYDYTQSYSMSSNPPQFIDTFRALDAANMSTVRAYVTQASVTKAVINGQEQPYVLSVASTDTEMSNSTQTALIGIPIRTDNTIGDQSIVFRTQGSRSYPSQIVYNPIERKFITIYGIPFHDMTSSNGVLAEIKLENRDTSIKSIGRTVEVNDIGSVGIGACTNLVYDATHNRVLGFVMAHRELQKPTVCLIEYVKNNKIAIPNLIVNKNGLDVIRQLTEASSGIFYQNHNGTWILTSRDKLPTSISGVITNNDVVFNSLSYSIDQSKIVNKIIFTVDGRIFIREHKQSIEQFGERTISINNELMQTNVIDIIASYYFELFAMPHQDFSFKLGRKAFLYDLGDIVMLNIDAQNANLHNVRSKVLELSYNFKDDTVGV